VIPADTERVIPAPAARITAKVVKNIRPMKALVQSPEYGSEAVAEATGFRRFGPLCSGGALIRFLVIRVTNYVISITSPPPFDQLSHLIFNAIDPIRLVIAITAHKWLLE
jgi:hypothetical protein